MWVCRAGYKAMYFNQFIQDGKIYLAWNGFNTDFHTLKTMQEVRNLVSSEMGSNNHTSVSNWSGQLMAFYKEIQIGDYVIIPHAKSQAYTLAIITGDYVYENDSPTELHHSRSISIINAEMPKAAFSQSQIYSLGAYRTIFKAKNEEEILAVFRKWGK